MEEHSGAVVCTVTSQQEGPVFESISLLACGFFAWSLRVLPVSARVLLVTPVSIDGQKTSMLGLNLK